MEITARELGYKNLINHKELGTVEVVGFNEEIIQYLHLDTIYYDEYSKFEAIPLTEEWLLKFGFTFSDMIYSFDGFEILDLKQGLEFYNHDYNKNKIRPPTPKLILRTNTNRTNPNQIIYLTIKK